MELRHLRSFVEIARQGNITRAAEALFIAQPALSNQMRQLEEELGVQLMVRRARGVELTAAGMRFSRHAQDVLEHAARAAAAARGEEESKPVRIGYVPSCAHTLLPTLLTALRSKSPDVKVESWESITADQFQRMAAGRLDVAMCRPLKVPSECTVIAELTDPYCLALPSTHRLAQRKKAVALSDAVDEDFISFPRFQLPAFFDRGIALCIDAGFSPRLAHEVTTFNNALQLVSMNVGVCIVPASLVLCSPGGVTFKPLISTGRTDKLVVVTPRTSPHPEVVSFAEPLRRAMKEMKRHMRDRIGEWHT